MDGIEKPKKAWTFIHPHSKQGIAVVGLLSHQVTSRWPPPRRRARASSLTPKLGNNCLQFYRWTLSYTWILTIWCSDQVQDQDNWWQVLGSKQCFPSGAGPQWTKQKPEMLMKLRYLLHQDAFSKSDPCFSSVCDSVYTTAVRISRMLLLPPRTSWANGTCQRLRRISINKAFELTFRQTTKRY